MPTPLLAPLLILLTSQLCPHVGTSLHLLFFSSLSYAVLSCSNAGYPTLLFWLPRTGNVLKDVTRDAEIEFLPCIRRHFVSECDGIELKLTVPGPGRDWILLVLCINHVIGRNGGGRIHKTCFSTGVTARHLLVAWAHVQKFHPPLTPSLVEH